MYIQESVSGRVIASRPEYFFFNFEVESCKIRETHKTLGNTCNRKESGWLSDLQGDELLKLKVCHHIANICLTCVCRLSEWLPIWFYRSLTQ